MELDLKKNFQKNIPGLLIRKTLARNGVKSYKKKLPDLSPKNINSKNYLAKSTREEVLIFK